MIELQVIGDSESRRTFGGDTLNVAVYAARCLEDVESQISFVTALGDDPFSDEMVAFIMKEDVDCTLIASIPGKLPGLCVITLKVGERTPWFWRNQAAARDLSRAPAFARIREALADYDALYFSGITLGNLDDASRIELLNVMQKSREAAAMVIFDNNYRPPLWSSADEVRKWANNALDISTHALPTFSDEALLFNDASPENTLDRIAAHGVGEIVVKDGKDPCLISLDGTRIPVAPDSHIIPVDTTAAGDSFNGAYLASRLQGKDAREAHRVAAHVIQYKGAIVPRRPA